MIKIKKDFNLKHILLIIGIRFFFTNALYASHVSENFLRVPMGEKETQQRIIGVMQEEGTAGGKPSMHYRQDFIRKAIRQIISTLKELEDPRIDFIIDEEKWFLLSPIAEVLADTYINFEKEGYDFLMRVVIEEMFFGGLNEEQIKEIIGGRETGLGPKDMGLVELIRKKLKDRIEEDSVGILSIISSVAREGGKILEVGAGEGDFVKGLYETSILPADYKGYTPIDIDDDAIEKARKKGVHIIKQDATEMPNSMERFDVVLFIYPETLDMQIFLNMWFSARGKLNRGGKIIILTMDYGAIDRHFYIFRNSIFYSKKLLKDDIPRTYWKPETSYEYIAFYVPILFSGATVETVIGDIVQESISYFDIKAPRSCL